MIARTPAIIRMTNPESTEGGEATAKLIAASVQWAELIMRKIDNAFPDKQT
jgi:hypothetical protein